jgi:DNA-binding beta-propeller fold protein YncE
MRKFTAILTSLAIAGGGSAASAEILAMMNYESKTPDQVKALKLSGEQERREGIAVIDVDPESPAFGRLLLDIPLDPKGVAHHIFYDRSMTKAYVTALAGPPLQVMDLTEFPWRLRTIDIPNCAMGEDVIFDEANEYWYLTCMNSANVWQGRVADDSVVGEISLPGTWPHGLGVNTAIDRVVVTSTVSADMKQAGDVVSVVKASTREPLGQVRLSTKEAPAGEAPVEILPVPGGTPAFYVTNMLGATLWGIAWDEASQDFRPEQLFDFSTVGASMPLEMYWNTAGDTLYVTTAVPGQLHIFDLSDGPLAPKLVKSLPAGEGAHHVAITKDERLAFVQNALLNLPGMSDGSITVVDLEAGEVIGSVDTLKEMGLNPNSIVLLPEWNHMAGH